MGKEGKTVEAWAKKEAAPKCAFCTHPELGANVRRIFEIFVEESHWRIRWFDLLRNLADWHPDLGICTTELGAKALQRHIRRSLPEIQNSLDDLRTQARGGGK